jgi:hypothetical protein
MDSKDGELRVVLPVPTTCAFAGEVSGLRSFSTGQSKVSS